MKLSKLFLLKWVLVIFIFIFVLTTGIFAIADVQVNLRFYEGSRKMDTPKTSVVTSYYLKPFFSGNLVLDVDLKEEKKEIKKIFNLINLRLLTHAQWGWKYGKTEKQFQLFVLNGHEFVVQLTLLKKRNHFRLEVIEKIKKGDNKVLETDIVLPQKKTSVFGFEDSNGKPFFLSFQRMKDIMIPPPKKYVDGDIFSIQKPRCIKKVSPKYPEEALKAKISGNVKLEATTDIYGRVIRVKVIEGHPDFNKAAIDAVKQWIYEPFIIDGKPRPVKFRVTISFVLKG